MPTPPAIGIGWVREAGGEEHAGSPGRSSRASCTAFCELASTSRLEPGLFASSRRAVASASSPSTRSTAGISRTNCATEGRYWRTRVACRWSSTATNRHRSGCRTISRSKVPAVGALETWPARARSSQPENVFLPGERSRWPRVTLGAQLTASRVDQAGLSALGTIDCRPSSSRKSGCGRSGGSLNLRVGLCAHPEGVAGSSMTRRGCGRRAARAKQAGASSGFGTCS